MNNVTAINKASEMFSSKDVAAMLDIPHRKLLTRIAKSCSFHSKGFAQVHYQRNPEDGCFLLTRNAVLCLAGPTGSKQGFNAVRRVIEWHNTLCARVGEETLYDGGEGDDRSFQEIIIGEITKGENIIRSSRPLSWFFEKK